MRYVLLLLSMCLAFTCEASPEARLELLWSVKSTYKIVGMRFLDERQVVLTSANVFRAPHRSEVFLGDLGTGEIVRVHEGSEETISAPVLYNKSLWFPVELSQRCLYMYHDQPLCTDGWGCVNPMVPQSTWSIAAAVAFGKPLLFYNRQPFERGRFGSYPAVMDMFGSMHVAYVPVQAIVLDAVADWYRSGVWLATGFGMTERDNRVIFWSGKDEFVPFMIGEDVVALAVGMDSAVYAGTGRRYGEGYATDRRASLWRYARGDWSEIATLPVMMVTKLATGCGGVLIAGKDPDSLLLYRNGELHLLARFEDEITPDERGFGSAVAVRGDVVLWSRTVNALWYDVYRVIFDCHAGEHRADRVQIP